MSGLSEEQQNIVQWYKGPMLVLGTPGSGKTTVIVNRICYLIELNGLIVGEYLVDLRISKYHPGCDRTCGRFHQGSDKYLSEMIGRTVDRDLQSAVKAYKEYGQRRDQVKEESPQDLQEYLHKSPLNPFYCIIF